GLRNPGRPPVLEPAHDLFRRDRLLFDSPVAETNDRQWSVIQYLPPFLDQAIPQVVAQLRLPLDSSRDAGQPALGEHHKDFESDETPRPLHRVDNLVAPPILDLVRHVSGLPVKNSLTRKPTSLKWESKPVLRIKATSLEYLSGSQG